MATTNADIIIVSRTLSDSSFNTDDTAIKLTAIIVAIANAIFILNVKVCCGWIIATTILAAIVLFIIFFRNITRHNMETLAQVINNGKWTKETIELLQKKFHVWLFFFPGEKGLFKNLNDTLDTFKVSTPGPNPAFIMEDANGNNITSQTSFYTLLIVVAASVLLCFNGKGSQSTTATGNSVKDSKCICPFDTIGLYTSALQDAMVPLPEEQDLTGLVIIDTTNRDIQFDSSKTIKLYSVKTDKARYATTNKYQTGDYEIFTFTKVDFFKKYKCYPGVDSVCRVKQLLGLSPWKDYKYVVQFSVKLSDIFRPCTDQSINVNACSFDISKATEKAREYLINYRNEVNYKAELKYDYPFTGLGYTYDWSPYESSHHGVSEFVIAKQKTVKIDTVYNILDFLKKGSK